MKLKTALIKSANANAVKSAYPDGKRRVVVELRRGYTKQLTRDQFYRDFSAFARGVAELRCVPLTRLKVIPEYQGKRKGLLVDVFEDVTLTETNLLFQARCMGKPKKSKMVITW